MTRADNNLEGVRSSPEPIGDGCVCDHGTTNTQLASADCSLHQHRSKSCSPISAQLLDSDRETQISFIDPFSLTGCRYLVRLGWGVVGWLEIDSCKVGKRSVCYHDSNRSWRSG